MRVRSLMILLGLACLVGAAPTFAAPGPYDTSLNPFTTKQDSPPDPRTVEHFMGDHPRKIDGLYAKRFLTSGPVMDWLEFLKASWDMQRTARIDRNAALIDLRKSIPEEGATLMKVVDATSREELLKFNSLHNSVPHDVLYAFKQARLKIAGAEADVARAQSTIASALASVDEAAAGLEILQSTNEMGALKARQDKIIKDAKSGWAQSLLKYAKTAVDAIKDPQKAMKTIGLDFLAEGFDAILTERALLEHAAELTMIADRIEALDKLIEADKTKMATAKLQAARQTLNATRSDLIKAAINRDVALADAKNQLLRLSLLEEGDASRGIASPKFFRALAKYASVTEIMAKYVEDATTTHYLVVLSGPGPRALYLYRMLGPDIDDVKGWMNGDYSTWIAVATETREFIGKYSNWYKRQVAESTKLLAAYDSRAHWNFTEAVVAHELLVMEEGGK